jgi:hypothetical protein
VFFVSLADIGRANKRAKGYQVTLGEYLLLLLVIVSEPKYLRAQASVSFFEKVTNQ